jgi:hypothetical protein
MVFPDGAFGMKFDRNLAVNSSNFSLPCDHEYALLLVYERVAPHVKLTQ